MQSTITFNIINVQVPIEQRSEVKSHVTYLSKKHFVTVTGQSSPITTIEVPINEIPREFNTNVIGKINSLLAIQGVFSVNSDIKVAENSNATSNVVPTKKAVKVTKPTAKAVKSTVKATKSSKSAPKESTAIVAQEVVKKVESVAKAVTETHRPHVEEKGPLKQAERSIVDRLIEKNRFKTCAQIEKDVLKLRKYEVATRGMIDVCKKEIARKTSKGEDTTEDTEEHLRLVKDVNEVIDELKRLKKKLARNAVVSESKKVTKSKETVSEGNVIERDVAQENTEKASRKSEKRAIKKAEKKAAEEAAKKAAYRVAKKATKKAAKEAEKKAAEEKAAEEKAIEEKAIEEKAIEEKAIEEKAIEEKVAEEKATEEEEQVTLSKKRAIESTEDETISKVRKVEQNSVMDVIPSVEASATSVSEPIDTPVITRDSPQKEHECSTRFSETTESDDDCHSRTSDCDEDCNTRTPRREKDVHIRTPGCEIDRHPDTSGCEEEFAEEELSAEEWKIAYQEFCAEEKTPEETVQSEDDCQIRTPGHEDESPVKEQEDVVQQVCEKQEIPREIVRDQEKVFLNFVDQVSEQLPINVDPKHLEYREPVAKEANSFERFFRKLNEAIQTHSLSVRDQFIWIHTMSHGTAPTGLDLLEIEVNADEINRDLKNMGSVCELDLESLLLSPVNVLSQGHVQQIWKQSEETLKKCETDEALHEEVEKIIRHMKETLLS